MGKGDMKTRRGKINAGSYGKTRPHKASVSVHKPAEKEKKAEKAETAPATKPRTPRKKKTEE